MTKAHYKNTKTKNIYKYNTKYKNKYFNSNSINLTKNKYSNIIKININNITLFSTTEIQINKTKKYFSCILPVGLMHKYSHHGTLRKSAQF